MALRFDPDSKGLTHRGYDAQGMQEPAVESPGRNHRVEQQDTKVKACWSLIEERYREYLRNLQDKTS